MLNYKSLLLFISLLAINNAFGQENVNTYKTKKGTSISIGDELTLGKAFDLHEFRWVFKLIGNNIMPVDESFKGKALVVKRIEINELKVAIYTSSPLDYNTELVIYDVEKALKTSEIVKLHSSVKFPAIIKSDTVGYYTYDGDLFNGICLTKYVPDSTLERLYGNSKLRITKLYNVSSVSSEDLRYSNLSESNGTASFYLKKAGKLKNASIALAAISATIAIVPSDPDSPNIDKNQKSKTIVSVIGGVASLILNVVGNSSLIKAGEALE